MLKLLRLFQLGTRLHNCRRWINYRCVFVFLIRAMIHRKETDNLVQFFCQNDLRKEILQKHPLFFSQLTRHHFYKKSATSERLQIIKQSLSFWEETVTVSALRKLYLNSGLLLWSEPYQSGVLSLELGFHASQSREGMMTITLRRNNQRIYLMNFWIIKENNHDPVFYIGAIQGCRNGLPVNKELTKYFEGYRPKNLLLFTLRNIAAQLRIAKIYGVTDYGFYANNHLIRRDRKLKTSLTSFWHEVNGSPCSDSRFFKIPAAERRKKTENIAPSKRNMYRKRFALLDKISTEINCSFMLAMKNWQKTS